MKEINYKNLIDKKLSKKTKEEDGTAYVAVDGQYEEFNGYGYCKMKWVTIVDKTADYSGPPDIPVPGPGPGPVV